MRWNDDLLAGFDLSQKSKVKEVKEKSKEKREKIPGTDFIMILRLIFGFPKATRSEKFHTGGILRWLKKTSNDVMSHDGICM